MVRWLVPGNPSEPLTWTTPRAVGAAKFIPMSSNQQRWVQSGWSQMRWSRTSCASQRHEKLIELNMKHFSMQKNLTFHPKSRFWFDVLWIWETMHVSQTSSDSKLLQGVLDAPGVAPSAKCSNASDSYGGSFFIKVQWIQWNRKTCGVGLWKLLPNVKHCLKNA